MVFDAVHGAMPNSLPERAEQAGTRKSLAHTDTLTATLLGLGMPHGMLARVPRRQPPLGGQSPVESGPRSIDSQACVLPPRLPSLNAMVPAGSACRPEPASELFLHVRIRRTLGETPDLLRVGAEVEMPRSYPVVPP